MSPNTNMNQQGSLQNRKDELKASFELTTSGAVTTILIRKARIVIGSVETADVKIADTAGIAPIHAVVELEFGTEPSSCKAMILDLASPTGVWVNGQRVVTAALNSGDVVKLGEASFRFGYRKPEPKELLPDQALLLIDANTVEPIFDYRPEVKDTLEAVYSWNDTILDVDHLVNSDALSVPAIYQNGAEVVLANKMGNAWGLILTAAMKGVVYIGGELKSVDVVRQSGKQILLGQNDFAKIETGTISVYLSQTIAPPVLRKKTNLVTDPFLAKSMGISLVATLALLFSASFLEMGSNDGSTVIENPPIDATKVTVHIDPKIKKFYEKKILAEPNVTKPLPTPAQAATKLTKDPGGSKDNNPGSPGEGAAAKGPKGASAKPQAAGNLPGNTGNKSNLSALESKFKSLSEFSKSMTKEVKVGAGGGSIGAFADKHKGLTVEGDGSGGGGISTVAHGLGKDGLRNGKSGTGSGISGTGEGTGSPKSLVLSPGDGGDVIVYGSINREAIEAAILEHKDEFMSCYQSELNAGVSSVGGKVIPSFSIGPSGRVTTAAIASSTLNNPNMEKCVLNVLKRIQFPLPTGGVSVRVKYPFNFKNQGK